MNPHKDGHAGEIADIIFWTKYFMGSAWFCTNRKHDTHSLYTKHVFR